VTGWDPKDLRRIAVQVGGETAGLLRDIACTREAGESVGDDAIRADLAAEDYIIEALRAEGFRGTVVSEEKGILRLGNDALTALIDPLDGTKNYSNCIPWASVSIAFAPTPETGRITPDQVIAGAITPVFYGDPLSFDDTCYLGGTPWERASPTRFIYVYIEEPAAAIGIARVIRELGGGYKVRSLGSAALEIAYVGLGRGTAFVDLRPKIRNIDVAAASGFAARCGVGTYNLDGSHVTLSTRQVERLGPIVVASRDIADLVLRSVRE